MKIEQVQRVYCVVHEGEGAAVDGGYTEEVWEGGWSEMCNYADQCVSAGNDYQAITATVTRKAGGIAECRVRRQAMDGDGGDDEQAAKPGSSRSNPQYSLRVTCVPQPILTHKLADGISGLGLEACKKLLNGGGLGSRVETTEKNQGVTRKLVREILDDNELMSHPVVKKLLKGVTSYYSPQFALEVRYKVSDPTTVSYQEACKIATPPGPFSKPAGKYNWLCMGTSVNGSGKEWEVTDTYMLSGPDGWDKDFYTK